MQNFARKLTLSPVRLGDAVYEQIATAIVDGTLEAGERIRDAEIAESLREALQRLEREGLIEMSASRYTRVTEVTPSTVDATLEFARYQTAMAARIAVERMDDESVELIDAILVRLARAAEDRDTPALREQLIACHLFFIEHTGNAVFQMVTAEVRFALQRNIHSAELRPRAPVVDTVTALREALPKRDSARIEQLVLDLFQFVMSPGLTPSTAEGTIASEIAGGLQ
jgi:DNA-binding GntR family transcriptional regulator